VSARGFVGLLRLDTAFPRPVGDIGNPNTFNFPVRARIVRGATAARVVRGDASALLGPFVDAGRALAAEGAVAIGTSCGFLAPFQRELAAALPVPFAASALLQLAWLAPLLPAGQRAGVITIDADALGAHHLAAAGAPLKMSKLPPLVASAVSPRTHMGSASCISMRAAGAKGPGSAAAL
jgi:hypothetical protein